MKQGFFITLYGINNIGKTTQAKKLVEKLNDHGYKAVYVKYPIYDLEPTGPKINDILRKNGEQSISEEELQTLFTQNRRDFEPTLRKMLEEGFIVVAEDYTGTGIAWGTAKGADQKWLEKLNEELLKEDLAILLTGTRTMAAKEKQHIHERDDELVQKVNEVLLMLAQKYGWDTLEIQPKPEDTAKLLFAHIQKRLPHK